MISRLNIRLLKNYIEHYKNDNVIFIWIPKTAGTSLTTTINEITPIQEYLIIKDVRKYFPNTGFATFGHISLRELVDNKIITKKYYQSSSIFCISRNPYDRFVSLFHYSKKVNRIPEAMTLNEFIDIIMNGIPPIGLYNVKGLSQCHPQVNWIKDIRIDKVFKFEEIIQNPQSIYDFLGIQPIEMTHLNKSITRKSPSEELNEEQIAFINTYYQEDFDYFGYSIKTQTIG